MIAEFLTDKYPVARKDHRSDCSWQHFDWMHRDKDGNISDADAKDIGMTDEDLQTLNKHLHRKFRILKGEKYFSQSGLYDGDFYYVKYPLEVWEIIKKYKLFIED